MNSLLLISAGAERFMNCFSNVEKWFMNQKEKCSPKPASINNDFYSWIPPMVSFIFSQDGYYQLTAGRGVGDKQECEGQTIWEVVHETAPVGGGWEWLPLPSWGFSSLGPAPPFPSPFHSPGIMHWIRSAYHLANYTWKPASSLIKTIFSGFVVLRQSTAETHAKLSGS